jgi:hypothetical protein
MTDAPETIWVDDETSIGGNWTIAEGQGIEYTRADIAALQFISVLPEAQFAAFAAAVDADGESPADISQARIAELEGVVKWYGEQARLARLIHSEGDEGRHAIHMDGGSRSRAALKAKP